MGPSSTPPVPPPMPKEEQLKSPVKSPSRPPLANVFSTQTSYSSLRSLSAGESAVLEELEAVLRKANTQQRSLDIHRTPEVFIDQQSDAEAVQEWLKMKDFSEGLRKRLSGTNGEQLLRLSKADLERIVGPNEIKRLYSQLTLQRNAATKFKTARTAELENVLEKFRNKAEDRKDTTEEVTETRKANGEV